MHLYWPHQPYPLVSTIWTPVSSDKRVDGGISNIKETTCQKVWLQVTRVKMVSQQSCVSGLVSCVTQGLIEWLIQHVMAINFHQIDVCICDYILCRICRIVDAPCNEFVMLCNHCVLYYDWREWVNCKLQVYCLHSYFDIRLLSSHGSTMFSPWKV